jgi:hypothetical protein
LNGQEVEHRCGNVGDAAPLRLRIDSSEVAAANGLVEAGIIIVVEVPEEGGHRFDVVPLARACQREVPVKKWHLPIWGRDCVRKDGNCKQALRPRGSAASSGSAIVVVAHSPVELPSLRLHTVRYPWEHKGRATLARGELPCCNI